MPRPNSAPANPSTSLTISLTLGSLHVTHPHKALYNNNKCVLSLPRAATSGRLRNALTTAVNDSFSARTPSTTTGASDIEAITSNTHITSSNLGFINKYEPDGAPGRVSSTKLRNILSQRVKNIGNANLAVKNIAPPVSASATAIAPVGLLHKTYILRTQT